MSGHSEIAIEVKNITKRFRIPHEKNETLKAAALNFFSKKRFTEFYALRDVSFEVNRGEFFGIIGRNGSGKSTLLKIIAGIYVPTNGKVKLKGRISPFLELGVGFNPELTARENVYLNGAILGLSKKEIDKKFDEIIHFSELEEFVDMKVKNFSSGMHVRLAFSIAIRAHAETLLIDEVLAVGDANFQDKCIKEFSKFKREGRTILFVTHGMDMVEKFCDRVLLLDKGKIVDLGKPGKVAHEYTMINSLGKEKELAEENISGPKDRWGDGQAKVMEMWMEDDQGTKKTVFERDEDHILVKTKIKFFEEAQKPIFGMTIRNSAGQDVFVTNSLWQKVNTNNFKKNQEIIVEYLLENQLAKGDYTISPAIAYSDGKRFYDWRDNWHNFSIVSSKEEAGMVAIKHKISIQAHQ